MKAAMPQRVQLNTRVWDKPLLVASSEAHAPHARGEAGAAAVKPVAEAVGPPHALSDIYTELSKLFRDL
jgi:hypothetical protein